MGIALHGKIGIFDMGLFSVRSNGYNLTFLAKIDILDMGLISVRTKGYSLTFLAKSVFSIWAYFRQKSKAYFFVKNRYFRYGPIFGAKQRV